MSLRHSRTREGPHSGYLTLVTNLRSHKRYIAVCNTAFRYGHRPDRILWTADLTQCSVRTTGKTVSLQLPSRKTVKFRMTSPELQEWYPLLMAGCMGLTQYYCVGAALGRFADGALFGACDRGDGDDVRVWRVEKGRNYERCCLLETRDKWMLELCERIDRAVQVVDVFEDCRYFHVVTEVFRGHRVEGVSTGATAIVMDVLSVVATLHEHGLAHTGLEEAVVVDGGRAWIMVYGFARPAGPAAMTEDVKAVGRILRTLVGKFSRDPSVERVSRSLERGAPAAQVLMDPCFHDCLVVEFESLERHAKQGRKGELESPRSVLPSGNGL